MKELSKAPVTEDILLEYKETTLQNQWSAPLTELGVQLMPS